MFPFEISKEPEQDTNEVDDEDQDQAIFDEGDLVGKDGCNMLLVTVKISSKKKSHNHIENIAGDDEDPEGGPDTLIYFEDDEDKKLLSLGNEGDDDGFKTLVLFGKNKQQQSFKIKKCNKWLKKWSNR